MIRDQIIRFVFAIAVISFSLVSDANARDDIEIVEAVWTSGVKDRMPVDKLGLSVSKPPLVLWTRMTGDRNTLTALKANGKLPIRHRWLRFIGAAGEVVRSTATDDISREIDLGAKLSELELEVARRSHFDWRFWSEKQNAGVGQWEVEILYATDEPVMCKRDAGAKAPCKFAITIK